MFVRWSRKLVSLVLASVPLAGCLGDTGSSRSPGELNHVDFSYQRSCFFGCPLEQPLLVGTRETITLSDAGDVPQLEVKSSNEQVAEFAVERACQCKRPDNKGGAIDVSESAKCTAPFEKHCDNSVLVQAVGVGDAQLELRDSHGKVIDRATVLVRKPKTAEFSATYADRLGAVKSTKLDLVAGDSLDLSAALYDELGRKLLAPEGVHWSSDDAEVADLAAFLIGGGAELDAGLDVVVQAQAAGTARITLSVPSYSQAVTVKVSAP